MPQSMLISRRRRNNKEQDISGTSDYADSHSRMDEGISTLMTSQTGEQNAKQPAAFKNHYVPYHDSSSSDLSDDETTHLKCHSDEPVSVDNIADSRPSVENQSTSHDDPQTMSSQALERVEPNPTTNATGDNQIESLTNAILYFVTLFNKQQQQQQQSQTQSQLNKSPTISISEGQVSSNQSTSNSSALRSAMTTGPAQSLLSKPLKKLNSQTRTQNKNQKIRLPQLTRTKLENRDQIRPKIAREEFMHQNLEVDHDDRPITFMDTNDLIESALMSQDGKRSSSSSGSGTGDSFVHHCQDCGKRYSTSSNLARHRQTHRDVTDKKAKKCPQCDKIYVSMPAFSMHWRTHLQGCICTFCGKSFSRPWLLKGHIRIHTGEKPFKCKICDKAFADKSNLRAHIQTHSTTKPHVCERCNKAFALKSYLCKHVESTCMKMNNSQKEPLNLKVMTHPTRRARSSQSQSTIKSEV